ncbi:unnamed protein product [Vicia faba]|uniref:Uncharacterized protein n=1 Tax=Vicia faba TaxID=3906 RepID=A0AAV1AK43_VICFA|nr:unnamed protein product [Vicia faba]
MILPAEEVIEEEVEKKDNQPQIRKIKDMEKSTQDLFIGFIQKGSKMLASALNNKVIEEPSDVEVLEEKDLQVEAVVEAILKSRGIESATNTQAPKVIVGVEKLQKLQ